MTISAPEALNPKSQSEAATLSGYPVAPVDVFACGVAMFILHAQASLNMSGLGVAQFRV